MSRKLPILPLFILLLTNLFLVTSSQLFAQPPLETNGGSPPVQSGFPVTLSGARVRYSSVSLGDVNGDSIDDIVVGGSDGKVYAYTGNGTKLWEYDTGDSAVESKAAIGDLDGDGSVEIVIGAGSTFTNAHGDLHIISHTGALECTYLSGDLEGNGFRDGVYSSPAIGDIVQDDGGKMEIFFGGWDHYFHLINHDCSLVWKKINYDTVWSSPSLADMNGDGSLEMIIGSDSNDAPTLGIIKGGKINVLNAAGEQLPGFHKFIDEVIFSSPAIGDFSNDGNFDITVGTGYFWANPACNHPDGCTPGVGQYINAWDSSGNELANWPKAIDGYTWGSPVLADIDNDDELELIINSSDSKVHALNNNGTYVPGWPVTPVTPGPASFATNASPVVADVDGDGNLEVFIISNWDVVAWDKNGNQLTPSTFGTPAGKWLLGTDFSLNSSPAIGDIDGDGDVELVVAGANSGGGNGRIYAWDFSGSVNGKLPWPMFRQNELNHGTVQLPPTLAVSATDIDTMHEFGDSSTIVLPVELNNVGSDSIDWSASTSNGRVSVSPNNGTITDSDVVLIEVDPTGLSVGTHNYTTTFSGTYNGTPVANSPETVSISVRIVNSVYRIFLPLIQR